MSLKKGSAVISVGSYKNLQNKGLVDIIDI